jgi:hypothetical protein
MTAQPSGREDDGIVDCLLRVANSNIINGFVKKKKTALS